MIGTMNYASLLLSGPIHLCSKGLARCRKWITRPAWVVRKAPSASLARRLECLFGLFQHWLYV